MYLSEWTNPHFPCFVSLVILGTAIENVCKEEILNMSRFSGDFCFLTIVSVTRPITTCVLKISLGSKSSTDSYQYKQDAKIQSSDFRVTKTEIWGKLVLHTTFHVWTVEVVSFSHVGVAVRIAGRHLLNSCSSAPVDCLWMCVWW